MRQLRKNIILDHILATSAHGLSRIILSKYLPIRILWILFCIGAVCAFTYHFYKLTVNFNSQPTTVDTILHKDFKFPDLYICNPFVISPSKLENLDKGTKQVLMHASYNAQMAELTRRLQGDRSTPTSEIDEVINRLLYSTLQRNILREIVQTKEQMIVEAYVNNIQLGLESFEEVPHDKFFSCIKFLNSSLIKEKSDHLKLTLFAETSEDTSSLWKPYKYKGASDDDTPSGLRIILTGLDEIPMDGEYKEILISSGMQTDLLIEMTSHVSLSKTDYPCSEGTDYNFSYTSKFSNEFCYISYAYAECKCRAIITMIPENDKCFNMTYFNDTEIEENYHCMNRTRHDVVHKGQCDEYPRPQPPCFRRTYEAFHSNAIWPFYNMEEKFVKNVLRPIYKQRRSKNISVPAWKPFVSSYNGSMTDAFRAAFLKLDISPSSSYSSVIKEKEAYPVFSYFSDIGGTLGLYLGVSMLTLCELFDLMFALITSFKINKEKMTSEDNSYLQHYWY